MWHILRKRQDCEVLHKDIANVKFGQALTLDMPKGQLISEGHLGFSNSSKKTKTKICPNRLGQKLEFSSSFFGRIEDTKMSFRD
jgi:hypothetical protein